ncbi:hypothetical protein DEJ38_15170 [Kocuria rosea]|nr:hypothetical protein DEJ38_15170 [Kocuria rosea]
MPAALRCIALKLPPAKTVLPICSKACTSVFISSPCPSARSTAPHFVGSAPLLGRARWAAAAVPESGIALPVNACWVTLGRRYIWVKGMAPFPPAVGVHR